MVSLFLQAFLKEKSKIRPSHAESSREKCGITEAPSVSVRLEHRGTTRGRAARGLNAGSRYQPIPGLTGQEEGALLGLLERQ